MAAAAATLAGLALVALTAAAHAQPVELVSGVPFNGTVALRNSILFVVRGGFSGSVSIALAPLRDADDPDLFVRFGPLNSSTSWDYSSALAAGQSERISIPTRFLPEQVSVVVHGVTESVFSILVSVRPSAFWFSEPQAGDTWRECTSPQQGYIARLDGAVPSQVQLTLRHPSLAFARLVAATATAAPGVALNATGASVALPPGADRCAWRIRAAHIYPNGSLGEMVTESAAFCILAQRRVAAPASGVLVHSLGSTATLGVTWDAGASDDVVRLELVEAGNTSSVLQVIGASLPDTGSFAWQPDSDVFLRSPTAAAFRLRVLEGVARPVTCMSFTSGAVLLSPLNVSGQFRTPDNRSLVYEPPVTTSLRGGDGVSRLVFEARLPEQLVLQSNLALVEIVADARLTVFATDVPPLNRRDRENDFTAYRFAFPAHSTGGTRSLSFAARVARARDETLPRPRYDIAIRNSLTQAVSPALVRLRVTPKRVLFAALAGPLVNGGAPLLLLREGQLRLTWLVDGSGGASDSAILSLVDAASGRPVAQWPPRLVANTGEFHAPLLGADVPLGDAAFVLQDGDGDSSTLAVRIVSSLVVTSAQPGGLLDFRTAPWASVTWLTGARLGPVRVALRALNASGQACAGSAPLWSTTVDDNAGQAQLRLSAIDGATLRALAEAAAANCSCRWEVALVNSDGLPGDSAASDAFSLRVGAIVLAQPLGGSAWSSETFIPRRVVWRLARETVSDSETIGPLSVELLRGGAPLSPPLMTVLANASILTLDMLAADRRELEPGADYSLRVRTAAAEPVAVSEPFRVASTALNVTSPGLDSWWALAPPNASRATAAAMPIEWRWSALSASPEDTVRAALLCNGSEVLLLTDGVANSGTAAWKLPPTLPLGVALGGAVMANCKVLLEAFDRNGVLVSTGLSGTFYLYGTQVHEELAVGGPLYASSLAAGEPVRLFAIRPLPFRARVRLTLTPTRADVDVDLYSSAVWFAPGPGAAEDKSVRPNGEVDELVLTLAPGELHYVGVQAFGGAGVKPFSLAARLEGLVLDGPSMRAVAAAHPLTLQWTGFALRALWLVPELECDGCVRTQLVRGISIRARSVSASLASLGTASGVYRIAAEVEDGDATMLVSTASLLAVDAPFSLVEPAQDAVIPVHDLPKLVVVFSSRAAGAVSAPRARVVLRRGSELVAAAPLGALRRGSNAVELDLGSRATWPTTAVYALQMEFAGTTLELGSFSAQLSPPTSRVFRIARNGELAVPFTPAEHSAVVWVNMRNAASRAVVLDVGASGSGASVIDAAAECGAAPIRRAPLVQGRGFSGSLAATLSAEATEPICAFTVVATGVLTAGATLLLRTTVALPLTATAIALSFDLALRAGAVESAAANRSHFEAELCRELAASAVPGGANLHRFNVAVDLQGVVRVRAFVLEAADVVSEVDDPEPLRAQALAEGLVGFLAHGLRTPGSLLSAGNISRAALDGPLTLYRCEANGPLLVDAGQCGGPEAPSALSSASVALWIVVGVCVGLLLSTLALALWCRSRRGAAHAFGKSQKAGSAAAASDVAPAACISSSASTLAGSTALTALSLRSLVRTPRTPAGMLTPSSSTAADIEMDVQELQPLRDDELP